MRLPALNFGTLSSFGIKERFDRTHAYMQHFGTLSSFGIKEQHSPYSVQSSILVLSHLLV